MKKRILVLLLFLAFLAFLSVLYAERTVRSILLLNELINFDKPGWLEKTSAHPAVKEVSWEGPLGSMKADLYLPPAEGKRGGILLNHLRSPLPHQID